MNRSNEASGLTRFLEKSNSGDVSAESSRGTTVAGEALRVGGVFL